MKKILNFVFVTLFTVISIGQVPTASLLAYYPFCGNANDHSANAQHGTVIGATLSTDRFGNSNSAYSFNGVTDYINLPTTSFIGLDIYSYSIWIRPTATTSVGSLVYSAGSNDPYCQSLSFNSTSVSAGSYNIGNNPIQSAVFSNSLTGINSWIHVVVTRDLSLLKMYVNGILIAQPSTANTNGQSADYGSGPPYRVVIGTRSTLSTYFFTGQIDDARIYSSVLNQNDVNALYNEIPNQGALSVNSGTICSGSSFTIIPSGAQSYTFSGGSSVVTPITNTNYTVTGNLNSGCLASAVASVSVNICTGIDKQFYDNNDFVLYPNPCAGSLRVSTPLAGKKNCNLILEDMQGENVRTYELNEENTLLNFDPAIKPGCYFAKLFIDGNCIGNKKIIITVL